MLASAEDSDTDFGAPASETDETVNAAGAVQMRELGGADAGAAERGRHHSVGSETAYEDASDGLGGDDDEGAPPPAPGPDRGAAAGAAGAEDDAPSTGDT